MVMGELDIFTIPSTIPAEDEIVGVTVQYMELGMNTSTTIP